MSVNGFGKVGARAATVARPDERLDTQGCFETVRSRAMALAAARARVPFGGWAVRPRRDDLVDLVSALNAPGRPPFFTDCTL